MKALYVTLNAWLNYDSPPYSHYATGCLSCLRTSDGSNQYLESTELDELIKQYFVREWGKTELSTQQIIENI